MIAGICLFSDHSTLALSVRTSDCYNGEPCVKHYRIRKTTDGSYWVSSKKLFSSILELIDHYSGKADSLFGNLYRCEPGLGGSF